MTPEQTKQLKPGDEIFIRARYIKSDDGGNIVFSCQYRSGGLVELTNYAMLEEVFSPSDLKVRPSDASVTEEAGESSEFRSLWRGEHLKAHSPEWDACMILRRLKTPAEDSTLDEKFEYFVTLREVGKLALNAASLAAMSYGEAKQKGESNV